MRIKRKSVNKAYTALSDAFWAVDEENEFLIGTDNPLSARLSIAMGMLRDAIEAHEEAAA